MTKEMELKREEASSEISFDVYLSAGGIIGWPQASIEWASLDKALQNATTNFVRCSLPGRQKYGFAPVC